MNVVDTSVLIDILRRDSGAVGYVRSLEEVPACSEVTRVEVVRGLRGAARDGTEQLFQTIRWVALDEAIARRAGELGRRWDRRRPGIALADLVRHFPMFEGLAVPHASC